MRFAVGLCILINTSALAHDRGMPHVEPHMEDAREDQTAETASEASATDNATIEVIGKKPITAASSSRVRSRDFLVRPRTRPADILQVTPGLLTIQHAGGGKANQYFLRGYDIDHGTDIAFYVDGIPVNNPSHGHGQGYTDLHWVIPEVVQTIEVYKGPYFAKFGDFANAGAVNFITRDYLTSSSITMGGGNFNTYRGLAMGKLGGADDAPDAFIAGEVYGTDGPFENEENTKRHNLFGKMTYNISDSSELSVAMSSYVGGWNASGQIPDRAVKAGTIKRFDAIDAGEGGGSTRQSVYLQYGNRIGDDRRVMLNAYLTDYRLNLYSNFTFKSRDPANGDMIEQTDQRQIRGVSGYYEQKVDWHGFPVRFTVGADARLDTVDNSLFYNAGRERHTTVNSSKINQQSTGVFLEKDIIWTQWFRTIFGVREDLFLFAVDDQLDDLATIGSRTSGTAYANITSPKATLIFTPVQTWDIYMNFGQGFHSNDARGVVRDTDAATPLTKTEGYELGTRTQFLGSLDLGLSYFVIKSDEETVWVGDAGETEPSAETTRKGVEAEVRYRINSFLFSDLDVTSSEGKIEDAPDGEDSVPLAPRLTVSAGLSAWQQTGVIGRLGYTFVGERPATEDEFIMAQEINRLDSMIGYRRDQQFEFTLSVQNVLNRKYNEAQFATVSRLDGEDSADDCPKGTRGVEEDGAFAGCEDLHFTPGSPRNVQASLTYYF